MDSRGFTLIELTALIVILIAIFLVSFPLILNTTRNISEKDYDKMVENACLAGESYIYSHLEDFNGLNIIGTKINIDIKELIEYGSLDKNIKNVKTGNLIVNDSLSYTVLDDFSLDCRYTVKSN